MNANKFIWGTFGVVLSCFLITCSNKSSNPTEPNLDNGSYQYTVPEQTDDGWETASVEDAGLTLQPLVDMVEYVNATSGHQIHNILIFKDNKLVFEEYFRALQYHTSPPGNGTGTVSYNKNMLHYLASGSKSVTSVLFGIAIYKGFIDGDVDKKILEYYPNYSSTLIGDKANISVKHLLTMTSGLDFDENSYPYNDLRNDVARLFQESDPIKFVLSKNMHAAPGTVFHYNSGITNVLGDIIRIKTNSTLLSFARENLFVPLGITQYNWQRIHGQYYFASGGLSLRPRDMAKIGSLFINGGQWNGTQMISQEWVEASTQSYITPNINLTNGYGYQWWVEDDLFMSAGLGGQYMVVSPSLNIIVVFNCGYFDKPEVLSPFELINNYIYYSMFPNGFNYFNKLESVRL